MTQHSGDLVKHVDHGGSVKVLQYSGSAWHSPHERQHFSYMPVHGERPEHELWIALSQSTKRGEFSNAKTKPIAHKHSIYSSSLPHNFHIQHTIGTLVERLDAAQLAATSAADVDGLLETILFASLMILYAHWRPLRVAPSIESM